MKFNTHQHRNSVVVSLALAFSLAAAAQSSSPRGVGDKSILKPPPGARVAIYEFEDLECPSCSVAAPVVHDAARKYDIPLERHDFPLAMHAWAFEAAVDARWFESKSPKLGDEYRAAVFANQRAIASAEDLRAFTYKFAASHQVAMPFVMDPQGLLAAKVKADQALGDRIGIDHTPTIWIVTSHGSGPPYVEVADTSKLYQMIDQAIAQTGGPAGTTAKSASTARK